MKNFLPPLICVLVVLSGVPGLEGAPMEEARLTKAVNRVEVIAPSQAPRAAKSGQLIEGQMEIQTGAKSMAELTFPDQTLARIGATSRFGFASGTRQIDLQNGTLLLQVPKDVGGATIRGAAVTAAITGTTVLAESSPGNEQAAGKIIVVEGRVKVSLNRRGGGSRTLRAGEMIVVPEGADKLPPPVTVDLRRLLRSSRLINAGGGLPDTEAIDAAVEQQQVMLERGALRPDPQGPAMDNPAMDSAQPFNNVQSRTDANPANQPQPPAPMAVPPPAPVPTPAPAPLPTPPPGPGPTPDYYQESAKKR